MSYEGWTNWDTWETMLVLDNDRQGNRWLEAWNKNWKRKIKRGTFEKAKARMVVRKYLVPVARGKTRAGVKIQTPDPEIDPSKVNADEIVDAILDKDYD